MAGEIGHSSPNRDRFSVCSLNQMQPVIEAADCLTPTDHVDLSVGPAGGLFPGNQAPIGENFDVVFEIENLGNSTANNVNVQVSMPPELTLVSLTLTGATCVPAAGSCDAGNVSGGSLRTLTLTLRGEIEGNFAVDVDVTADNDEDNTNNFRRTNIWMRRFVDLLAQFNTESSAAGVGERQQRTLTTINQGTHTAQNVDIRFTRGPDIVLEMGESESADCVTVNGVVTCTVDSLAPQDSVTVTIFFSASSAGTTQVNARATSDNPDLTPADNNDQVTITASSQVNAQNSGGGGGGSLTWLSLLMLLSVAAVRAADPTRVVNPRNSIPAGATD